MSNFETLTVLSGQTESNALSLESNLFSKNFVAFITPANLTSTSISFKVSHDGSTFVPLKDATNNLVTITVNNAAAAYNSFDTRAFRHIKLVCGSAEAADRTFQVILHRL